MIEKGRKYEINPEEDYKKVVRKELSILEKQIWVEKVRAYKKDLEKFIFQSITNTLPNYLAKLNAKGFDKDKIKWFSKKEFSNYLKTLYMWLYQLIEAKWYDNLKEVYKDVKDIHWYDVDLFLADKSNGLVEEILWNWNWWKNLLKEIWNYSGKEIKQMGREKFDMFSSQSWKETIILVAKDIPNNIKWILKFFADLPSAAMLLPRYLIYRSKSLEGDAQSKLKYTILSENNVVLWLINLIWPEWIEVLKKLVEQIKSGTQWAVAMAVVTIFGLLAGWAGVVKLWAKFWKMEKLESVADKIEWLSNKVDWTINTGWANLAIKPSYIRLAGKLNTAEDVVKANAKLSDKERLTKAENILGRKLTKEQKNALLDAHNIWDERVWAWVYNYTKAELLQKARILKKAWLNKDGIRTLMENGIVGSGVKKWFWESIKELFVKPDKLKPKKNYEYKNQLLSKYFIVLESDKELIKNLSEEQVQHLIELKKEYSVSNYLSSFVGEYGLDNLMKITLEEFKRFKELKEYDIPRFTLLDIKKIPEWEFETFKKIMFIHPVNMKLWLKCLEAIKKDEDFRYIFSEIHFSKWINADNKGILFTERWPNEFSKIFSGYKVHGETTDIEPYYGIKTLRQVYDSIKDKKEFEPITFKKLEKITDFIQNELLKNNKDLNLDNNKLEYIYKLYTRVENEWYYQETEVEKLLYNLTNKNFDLVKISDELWIKISSHSLEDISKLSKQELKLLTDKLSLIKELNLDLSWLGIDFFITNLKNISSSEFRKIISSLKKLKKQNGILEPNIFTFLSQIDKEPSKMMSRIDIASKNLQYLKQAFWDNYQVTEIWKLWNYSELWIQRIIEWMKKYGIEHFWMYIDRVLEETFDMSKIKEVEVWWEKIKVLEIDNMKSTFAKRFEDAPVYQKKWTVYVRQATEREEIISSQDGTKNIAEPWDWIIQNPNDPHPYVFWNKDKSVEERQKDFLKKYEPTDKEWVFKAKWQIKAFKITPEILKEEWLLPSYGVNGENIEWITFPTSWWENMSVKFGGYIADGGYSITEEAFNDTYELLK